jgi:large subunit ribosomal protein L15
MQIHEYQLPKDKDRKRVGRGGKRGTYSGRGMKGQKARSGSSIDPLFEGGRSSLVERMKKIRGKGIFHMSRKTISLDMLEKAFTDGETVSLATLREKGLFSRKKHRGAKIVLKGECKKKLNISQEIRCSQKAKEALEAFGSVFGGAKKEKK